MIAQKPLTQIEAIEFVLSKSASPLTDDEIAEAISTEKLAQLTGKTLPKTVTSRISIDIKLNGSNSRFKRVKSGKSAVRYTLRSRSEREYFPPRRAKRVRKNESVLVFRTDLIDELGHFEGVSTNTSHYLPELLKSGNSFFIDRADAENTEDFKQVISYAIIRFQGALLRYTRGTMTNVSDLSGYTSLGFGGHVQLLQDFSMFSSDMGYANSTQREVREETTIEIPISKIEGSIAGLINDESSELGRKHFAIVHIIDLEEIPLHEAPGIKRLIEKRDLGTTYRGKIGEISIRNFTFASMQEVEGSFKDLEFWSKLCVASFFGENLQIKSQIEAQSPRRSLKEPIIVVTGRIGSGKSEACKILNESFGYKTVKTSEVLRKLLNLSGTPGRRELQDLGLDFVNQEQGHYKLAAGLVNEIQKQGVSKFAIDGIRFPETFKALIELLGMQLPLIYLENTNARSYEFYSSRGEDSVSSADFTKVLAHPVERRVSRFKQNANYVVYNYGSRESFHAELKRFFAKELGNG